MKGMIIKLINAHLREALIKELEDLGYSLCSEDTFAIDQGEAYPYIGIWKGEIRVAQTFSTMGYQSKVFHNIDDLLKAAKDAEKPIIINSEIVQFREGHIRVGYVKVSNEKVLAVAKKINSRNDT